jgi:hypothetical protein
MMRRTLTIGTLAVAALTGCSNTVRYLTPITWSNGPEGAAASAAPADPPAAAAPAAPAAAEGTPPAAAAAAPPASGDPDRILYVTYWEGTCSSGVAGISKGCSKGDTKVKRCNLKPDNSMTCVDEVEATKAFATSN